MVDSVEFTWHDVVPARADVVRVAQLTDSHIFAEKEGCLLGLNTRRSFEAVCERVKKEEWKPDVILATGDLSQDASPQSYQYLADFLATLKVPSFWLPGNHDDPQVMAQYLTNQCVSSAKQILLGDWQIILLDSSVKDKVYGNLSESELAFLSQALQQHPNKHALVSLHHQPVTIDSHWLDQIGLKNAAEFKQVLAKFPQVKGVVWGHIHQDFEFTENGVHWMATPSSCVQFEPGSEDFSAGEEAPGYRFLNLYPDGRVESVVHRIDNMEFTVDYTIKGY
ncbi:3',5'-cyclic-AMP phosphodiesterase [Aliikangiella sp. IMCC44632]